MEHMKNIVLPHPSAVPLAQVLRLVPGRAHEGCGPARRVLAAWMMAQLAPDAPVIWIRPRWNPDRLCPQGLRVFASPDALIIVEPARASEILACAEEALRTGACALVVAELPDPPAMTPLRRLHLAAEAGLGRRRSAQRQAGLTMLLLTPGAGGTPGVESRWHLAPVPAPRAPHDPSVEPAWRLGRLRARMAPPAAWEIDAALRATPCAPALP